MDKLLIYGGELYNGLGDPAINNTGILVEQGIIMRMDIPSIELESLLENPSIHAIDATDRWIMPGLIDGHCHLTFGHPGWGQTLPDGSTSKVELCTLRAIENAKAVLASGVTGISVPGGAWFADVAVRDAVNLGVTQGPRIFAGGRFISTYDTIADPDPSSIGTPEHGIGILANTKEEMVAEVRRQAKNGVDLIKVGDSPWGNEQMISLVELQAITDEAHRRNKRVTIHARGAGSTRIAAEAGVDWIMHADYARAEELVIVAERGTPIMPTLSALEVICRHGAEYGIPQPIIDQVCRNRDCAIAMLELSREYGITLLCGTDTGNSQIMKYGKYHALEMDLLMEYAGLSPQEAIKAATSDNALTLGLEGKLGALTPGYMADLIVVRTDPAKGFASIHDPQNLEHVVKAGELTKLIPFRHARQGAS